MNEFSKRTINDLLRQAERKKKHDEEPPKVYKSLSYIPQFSERLLFSNIFDKDSYKLACKSNNTVNRLYSRTKTRLPKEEKSNVVYEIPCNGDGTNICNNVYVGTTKTKLKTRITSHRSDLNILDKPRCGEMCSHI